MDTPQALCVLARTVGTYCMKARIAITTVFRSVDARWNVRQQHPLAVAAAVGGGGAVAIATVVAARYLLFRRTTRSATTATAGGSAAPVADDDDDSLFNSAPVVAGKIVNTFDTRCQEITQQLQTITALVASISDQQSRGEEGEKVVERSSKSWLQADEWITQLMVKIDHLPLSDTQASKGSAVEVEVEAQRRRGIRRGMLQACWDLHQRLEAAAGARPG